MSFLEKSRLENYESLTENVIVDSKFLAYVDAVLLTANALKSPESVEVSSKAVVARVFLLNF